MEQLIAMVLLCNALSLLYCSCTTRHRLPPEDNGGTTLANVLTEGGVVNSKRGGGVKRKRIPEFTLSLSDRY
eukprot:747314-Hanusia_phi.AAC.7